jgi:hypothetical protein
MAPSLEVCESARARSNLTEGILQEQSHKETIAGELSLWGLPVSLFTKQTSLPLICFAYRFMMGCAFYNEDRSPIFIRSEAAQTAIRRGQNVEFIRFVSNSFVVNRASCAYNSLSLGGSLMPVSLITGLLDPSVFLSVVEAM